MAKKLNNTSAVNRLRELNETIKNDNKKEEITNFLRTFIIHLLLVANAMLLSSSNTLHIPHEH